MLQGKHQNRRDCKLSTKTLGLRVIRNKFKARVTPLQYLIKDSISHSLEGLGKLIIQRSTTNPFFLQEKTMEMTLFSSIPIFSRI